MKKRLLSLTIVLLMFVSMLGACGNNTAKVEDGSKSNNTPASDQGNTQETEEDPYHVTFAYIGNEQQDMDKVEAEINKITLRDLNMTVDIIQLGFGDYTEKTKLMLSGGEALDILPIFFQNAASYINAGQLVNMNDYVQQYGQGIIEQLGEDVAMGGQINGFLYGFPAQKEAQTRAGVVMRKDIVDKYNIDVDSLKTYEDMTAVYEKIHQGEPNMDLLVGYNMITQIETKDPLFDGFGVLMMREGDPTKVVNYFETEEYKKRAHLMRDWYEAGYIMPDAATSTESSANLVKAGNAFSYLSPVKPGFLTQANINCGHEMIVAFIEDAEYTYSSGVNFFNWGIAHTSKDPAKAMQFLNYAYTSSEFMNLLNWGIEGEHYKFVNDAKTIIDFPDGIDASNTKYNLNIGWELPNQYIAHIWKGNTEDIWEQYKEFNNAATKSPAFGFIYDSTDVANELTALTNVNNQYLKALDTGSVDPDEILPRFNQALYDAGLQKVIDTKQEQLDAWFATKK